MVEKKPDSSSGRERGEGAEKVLLEVLVCESCGTKKRQQPAAAEDEDNAKRKIWIMS